MTHPDGERVQRSKGVTARSPWTSSSRGVASSPASQPKPVAAQTRTLWPDERGFWVSCAVRRLGTEHRQRRHSGAYSFAPLSPGPVHKPSGHDVECLGSAVSGISGPPVSVLLEKPLADPWR